MFQNATESSQQKQVKLNTLSVTKPDSLNFSNFE